jgi:sec-independent protein translocase protein TatA
MFGSLGVPELLLILVIVLIVFGAGKLPQLGRGLGEGIKNFRNALRGEDKKAEPGEETKKAP